MANGRHRLAVNLLDCRRGAFRCWREHAGTVERPYRADVAYGRWGAGHHMDERERCIAVQSERKASGLSGLFGRVRVAHFVNLI